jgi:hypothetical protein
MPKFFKVLLNPWQEPKKTALIYGGVALFFLVLSPWQYERLAFGNRPQLIDAYLECQASGHKIADDWPPCNDFKRLHDYFRTGEYREGQLVD